MPMLKKNRKITFNILICVENDGDAYYAHCPALEGVHVDGETREEALENAKVAAVLYIKSLIKHGDPIPIQIVQKLKTQESCKVSRSRTTLPCPPRQVENVLVTV